MVVTILAPVARRGAPATAIAQVAGLRPGVVAGILTRYRLRVACAAGGRSTWFR